jgi:hypothetical protein
MKADRQRWGPSIAVVLRAVVPRPSLWWEAVAVTFRLARSGWWHRRPFLPLPGEDYWGFRMETAFGGAGDGSAAVAGALSVDDVVAYLRWCQRTRPRRG